MDANSYVERIRVDRAGLWKNRSPLLRTLDMELTERCNLDCIHCYINQPAGSESVRKMELSTEDLKNILGEAAELGCLTVRFTGGEPLLREDFCEIYRHARGLGLRVRLMTNATRITPALAAVFKRIPPLEEIEVTLYGARQSSYEAVTRTPNSFRAAFKGLQLLEENNIAFELKTVLLPPNRLELAALESLACSFAAVDEPPGCITSLNLRGRRDSISKNRCIKHLRLSPAEGMNTLIRRGQSYLNEMKAFCARFLAPPGEALFSCGAGKSGTCVDAYGNLQACILLRQPETIYRFKTGSLENALTRFFPELRTRKSLNPQYLQRCARCFLKALCEQCPAISWIEHGTLDTPVEYACELAHAQATYLGLLEAEEEGWQIRNWQDRVDRLCRSA